MAMDITCIFSVVMAAEAVCILFCSLTLDSDLLFVLDIHMFAGWRRISNRVGDLSVQLSNSRRI